MKTTTTIRSSLMGLVVCLMACVSATNLQAQSPTITSFTPATGSVGTLVTISGTNLTSPTTFSIGGVNAIVISNTGSDLVGMVMPGAVTGGVVVTTAGGTANGSSNFAVTPTQYPSTQQGAKLVGIGAGIGSVQPEQGASVSLSADGNTALVGGPVDNNHRGAAWVFIRSGGIWTQQGSKLVGTGAGAYPQEGVSVSLSADGNTAIIGGSNAVSWIFIRNGTTWTQQGNKLVVTGNVGATKEAAVSLSADGNTAIIGGYDDNSSIGAAWIFIRNGTTWTQQGNKLVGTGNVGASYQGRSVSLSADGNTALVGGVRDSLTQGAAWVFVRNGSTWSQQGAKLVGTGNVGAANQGSSVSLSADGNTAIVGGWYDNSFLGAAWVFTRSGNTWSQQGAKLVGSGAINGPTGVTQGCAVSLSADGNTAFVGGFADNMDEGAAWVFTRSGGVWTQQGDKLVGTGSTPIPWKASSVSLSADGNTALMGGPQDNGEVGSTWVFASSSLLPVKLISFTGTKQGTNNLLHWSTASEQNNKGFELQGSADGESFRKVAFVNTKAVNGSSTEMLTYSFTDKTPISGNNYYRLKQVDNDGKETFSNVVLIKGEIVNESMTVELFPNPGRIQFTLIVNSTNTQPVSIRVMDAVGNIVYQAKGNAEHPFRFGEKFANGEYLVEVRQGEVVKTVKAVKMK